MHPHWHRDRRSRRWWWHLCLAWWCAGFIRFNQCLVSNYVAAYCCIIMLLKIMLLNESTKHCECYFSETKWNSQMSAPCQSDMLECKMQNTAIVYQAQLRVRTVPSHWEPEDCGEVRDRSCGQEAPDHFDLGPGGKVSSGKLSRRKFLAKSA